MSPVTLILGGARSGKSRLGERLTRKQGPATYVATAQAWDEEMKQRIQLHKDQRDSGWMTYEEPFDIAALIQKTDRPMLIDCLTLWLTNMLLSDSHDLEAEQEILLTALKAPPHPILLVANEVGLGIVPENALARRFRDHAGLLNQRIAQQANHVIFTAAGLPLVLKGAPDLT